MLYEHHAIITEKNGNSFTLIEATNSATGASSDSSSGKGKALIKTSSTKFDFQRERISVVIYKKRVSKRKTVERAKYALFSREWSKDYIYHLLWNNCEHFARYCTTGQRCSIQVDLFLLFIYGMTKINILANFTTAKTNELYMYKLLKKHDMICDNCFRLSYDLADVIAMPITNGKDVKPGDVVRFQPSPDNMHDAVILEVHRYTNLRVYCTIMHYAFIEERTIQKDTVTIELNGKYRKLDYTSNFNVYTPDEVVRRAQSRENEQLHKRVFNDSRCFARWCQIKEHKKGTLLVDIISCVVF